MSFIGEEGSKMLGPTYTDLDGELPKPMPFCRGCEFYRIIDFHYQQCADIEGAARNAQPQILADGQRMIQTDGHPPATCRFLG